MFRMTVHRMATMVRIGSLEGYSSGLAPGSTDLMGFMAMSTSATILATATMDRCQNAGNTRSTASRRTRRTMSMATRVLLHMTGPANTPRDLREADTPVGVVTPVLRVVTAKPRKGPLPAGLLNWRIFPNLFPLTLAQFADGLSLEGPTVDNFQLCW